MFRCDLTGKDVKVRISVPGSPDQSSHNPSEDREPSPEDLQLALLLDIARCETLPHLMRGCAMSKILKDFRHRACEDSQIRCIQDALRRVSSLVTYEGDWGDFSAALAPLPSDVTVGSTVALLQQLPAFVHLVAKCEQFWQSKHGQTFKQYVFSIELCCKTLLENRKVKVHIHVWFQKDPDREIDLRDILMFGTRPHLTTHTGEFCGGRGRRSLAASWSGAFYLQAGKIGTLATGGTIQPFVGYPVKDYWVTALFTSEKITAAQAKVLYLRCVQRASANSQLEYVTNMKRRIAMEEEHRQVSLELMGSQRPFVVLPEVVDWQRQYERTLSRYRFLVLDGPSMTGKTRFALSLSPPPATETAFYADCSSGLPDMRLFEPPEHKMVILDELRASSAVLLKKMLQASNDVIQLGTSPTMQFAYSKNCWRTMFVICTNTWAFDLKSLDECDVKWLEVNSVYIAVDRPLFT
jgi:hypothetical protein